MLNNKPPSGLFTGLPVYTNDAMAFGSWSSWNMVHEILTMTYANGTTVDFRTRGASLILGPHNAAYFVMSKASYDRLCETVRNNFKIVASNEG